MTNWCKNITLPQTSFAGGKNPYHVSSANAWACPPSSCRTSCTYCTRMRATSHDDVKCVLSRNTASLNGNCSADIWWWSSQNTHKGRETKIRQISTTLYIPWVRLICVLRWHRRTDLKLHCGHCNLNAVLCFVRKWRVTLYLVAERKLQPSFGHLQADTVVI